MIGVRLATQTESPSVSDPEERRIEEVVGCRLGRGRRETRADRDGVPAGVRSDLETDGDRLPERHA